MDVHLHSRKDAQSISLLIPAIFVIAFCCGDDGWKPVPNNPGCYYKNEASLPTVCPQRVDAALRMAIELLPWEGEDRDHVLAQGVSIYVRPGESWMYAGQEVAGLAYPEFSTVWVDQDLTSLYHELLHIGEYRLGVVRNDAHTGWEEKGYYTLDAAYEFFAAGLSTVCRP